MAVVDARTTASWSPASVVRILQGLTIIGVCAGLLMVYSSSYPFSLTRMGDPFAITFRQAMYAGIGLVLFFAVQWLPLSLLRRTGVFLHLLLLGLLIATLVVGKAVSGAQRWLAFGPIQLQPSEFAKVTLVICLSSLAAAWLEAFQLRQKAWIGISLVGCLLATVGLVLVQPHLSGGALLTLIGVATLFFARLPFALWLAIVLLLGSVGFLSKEHFLHSYQRERWQLSPLAADSKKQPEQQKTYQVRQALLGLQVGGWFGQGFFKSRQKHLFLPSAHNDFIFAVIGEEFGFVGSLAVLMFFSVLAYFGIWVTAQARDAFASGIAGGITVGIWTQAISHIAVNTNTFLPPTGIPLPFFSAGGSSLCATLLGMGLLVNVAKTLCEQRTRQRGGTDHALGDRRRGDRGTHLSRPRPRQRRPSSHP